MKPIHRRRFLKGAGVTLWLPMLDALRPARAENGKKSKPVRRMVLIDLAFGLHGPYLFPKTVGSDYELTPYLSILKEYRKNFTIISGTSHPDVGGGHLAGKSFLTAAPRPQSTGFKNSISVDQVAAELIGLETRFSSLSLTTNAFKGLSFGRNGVELPSESSPSRLFAQLFLDGDASDRRRQLQNIRDGRSILDSLQASARAMQRRIGPGDQHKLDQYFTAVRSTEQRLTKAEAWDQTPKPQVSVKPPQDINNGADLLGRARLMFDMIHLALMTDSTRVVSLYNSGFNVIPPIEGITQDYHNLSHHGQDPGRLAELKIIETGFLTIFAEFLGKLRDTQMGNQTLLDETMVMLGSELGNASSHDTRNLPVILAGGGFKHGRHMAFDQHKNYPLPNLFVSMLQQLGLEIDKFSTSTGTMTGLETI